MKSKNYLFLLLALQCGLAQAQWSVIDSLARGNFQSTHFITADTGFTYHEYGTLRRTTNGGQTWDSVAIPFEGFVYDFDFPTSNVGYLAGGAWFPFGQYYGNAILKTIDGGLTWDSVMGTMNYGVINSIQAISPTEYFAAGTNLVLHSSNGGLTHDTLQPSANTTEDYAKIYFSSSTEGYVLGSSYIGGSQSISTLYKTTNGGLSWQSAFMDTSFWGAGDFVVSPTGEIYKARVKGEIMYSPDKGQSWQKLPFADSLMVISKLELNGTMLYAIGRDGVNQNSIIYRSADKGVSWQAMVSSSSSFNGFIDMSFPTAGTGYAVTNSQVFKNTKLVSLPETISHGFELYPNPASDVVIIKLVNASPAQVYVYNGMGQKVTQLTTDGTHNLELQVSSLKAGIYFIEVVQEGERFSRRLVKQ